MALPYFQASILLSPIFFLLHYGISAQYKVPVIFFRIGCMHNKVKAEVVIGDLTIVF